jgi:hypothetical protein
MGGSPSPPSIPSYTQVGAQQQQLNQQSQQGSMVNQANPFGSLTYAQTGTGQNGVPLYSATESYSPQIQALFNQGTGTAGALGATSPYFANAAMGAIPMAGYNFGQATGTGGASNAMIGTGLGEIASGNYGAGNNVQGQTQALTNQMMGGYLSSMDPFFQMQNEQQRTQLLNAGLSPTASGGNPATGTDNAYDNAMRQLQFTQGQNVAGAAAQFEPQAYAQAVSQYQLPATVGESLLQSGAGLGQLGQGYSSAGYGAYGAGATGMGTALQGLQGLESMTPGLSSTLTSTPSLAPADLTSAYNTQVQAQMQQYQAQLAQQNAMFGALGQMGGMGMLGLML